MVSHFRSNLLWEIAPFSFKSLWINWGLNCLQMKFPVYNKMYGSEGYQSSGSKQFQSTYKVPIRMRAYLNRQFMRCLGLIHYPSPCRIITQIGRPPFLLSRVDAIMLYSLHSRQDGNVHADECRLYHSRSCLWKEWLSRKCRHKTTWNLNWASNWSWFNKSHYVLLYT